MKTIAIILAITFMGSVSFAASPSSTGVATGNDGPNCMHKNEGRLTAPNNFSKKAKSKPTNSTSKSGRSTPS